MKSTGTKRLLSVLSAGALIASMSAIPVFASASTDMTNADVSKFTWSVDNATASADGTTKVKLTATYTETAANFTTAAKAGIQVEGGTVIAGDALSTATDVEGSSTTKVDLPTVTVPVNKTTNVISYKVVFTADGSDWVEVGENLTVTQAAAKDIETSQSFTYNAAKDKLTTVTSALDKVKAVTEKNNDGATWTLVDDSIKINGESVAGATGSTTLNNTDKSLEFDAEATPKDGYLIGGKSTKQKVHFSITLEGDTAIDAKDRTLSPYMDVSKKKVSDVATLVETDAKAIEGVATATAAKVEKYDAKTDKWTEIIKSNQAAAEIKDGEVYRVTASYTAKDGYSAPGRQIVYTVTIKAKEANAPTSFENGSVTLSGLAGQKTKTVKAAMTNADAKEVSLPTDVVFKDTKGPKDIFGTPVLYKTLDDAKNAANAIPDVDATVTPNKDTVIAAGTYYTVYAVTASDANVELSDKYATTAIPQDTKLIFKVSVTSASTNNNDDDDTGSSSDTTTDFTKDEMDTSTVSGNTFNHAKPEVLQSKLNDNKGTSISIGEVKSGTTTVASFAVTLPKNSKNVSQNTVNKVINVLNTISTKSASKNAQSTVDELLKSADSKNTASMPISFSRSMDDFGMTVSVTVPVTSKFTNGGTSLYYYNSSTKKLEAQKTTVAIRGGKATFDLTHASEYFLIQGVKDLSAGEGANDSEDTLSSTEATTVATSEAPVVTAPEVTEPAPVDTTVPSVAANPGTGNAPIALAVIPVAVAAAAIIAKKAK